MENLNIVILILTLFASALFSGLEFAFISANKLSVELQKQKGGRVGNILARYYSNATRFLGTTLVGNNIALVVYGLIMTKLLEEPLNEWFNHAEFPVMFCQTIISTIIILIFAEFLPKNLFRINPTGILKKIAIPFYPIYMLFYPFVAFIVWLSNILLTLFFGLTNKTEDTGFGKIDLQNYIKQTNKKTTDSDPGIDTNLFDKALHLTNTKVRECMIPRPEIVAVEQNEAEAVLKQKFIDSRHSKLIVYEDNIDNVIGYMHHQDILKGKPRVWETLVVPEAMPAAKLLNELIKQHKTIAWVVDEFGGTAGIVTLEDILEEIFGEIHDEHDGDFFMEKKISDVEFEFSGRHEIDYLNEKYPFAIPDGDYETLAGYILQYYESIPQKNDLIPLDQFEFLVTSVSHTRIETVRMKILPN